MALVAQHSISIIFPAYNEEDNIAKAVGQAVQCMQLLFRDWEVIVVDDGSRDKTGEIIDGLAEQNPHVIALHHGTNQGYGAALKTGILQASKELIFFCDSDLQFHLSELVLPLTWIEQYDIVIGYRSKRQDPLHRRLNAFGWNVLVRLLLGLKVKDIDCAFKLFRSVVFQAIQIDAVGAMVNTDILVQAIRMGFKIKELPVTHFPRLQGKQTGANVCVVLRAFRELFGLYRKFRNVRPIVIEYDRRHQRQHPTVQERRRAERRRVMLPINFPDRRQRYMQLHGTLIPLSLSGSQSVIPNQLRLRSTPRPWRIAMVAACPFPANHGTPAGIRETAEAIARKGHQVHLVTYHFGDGPPPQGVHIHRIADLRFGRRVVVGPTWQKPLFDLLMAFTLWRVIRREGIDLIHAHNYEGALVGYAAKLLTWRPLVYNAVNTMSDELPSYRFIRPQALAQGLARLLDAVVPRLADRVIAISEELAQFLRRCGVHPDRLQMIPLGINTAIFDAIGARERAAIREQFDLGDRPVVMYTGILDRFQRVDYLLRAMRHVVDLIPTAHLLLVTNVATEEDLQACRALIAELGLQHRVDIIPQTAFEDIPRFLAAADVTVVPRPHCPGFPVKLLNYMAAGKPIVLFEGSAKGLQHRQHAIVVTDHDWHALGQGIVTLLQDLALAQSLGQNARQWAEENLSWPSIVGKIEHAYAALLEPAEAARWEGTAAVGLETRTLDAADDKPVMRGVHVP